MTEPTPESVKACAQAIMVAIKDFDPTTRIVALEMLHAVAIVNDTDYEPETHRQMAIDSFANELDKFVETAARAEQ